MLLARAVPAASAAAGAAVIAAATEHLHLVGDDLGDVALIAVAVVVGAGLDLALDIDLLALVQVLAGNLRQPAPHDDVVPFGLFLLLPLAVLETLAGRQRKGRHGCAGRGVAQLGILTEISHQNYLVHRH